MTNNFIDKIRLLFVKEDKELYLSLYSIIGFYPHNIEYYKLALMHKSVARRTAKGKPANNERLEFLGDAILDAIVGDIVFHHFDSKKEGFLTNTRSKIVQRDTLNKLAHELGIDRLILSSGRNSSHNSYMGGNAFEALVGAIYLDRGYDACMRFMEKQILAHLIDIDKVAYKEVNFKSKLIEWGQKNRVRIVYKQESQDTDKNGSPVFSYRVLIEDIECCAGKGYSKKESQQEASKHTIQLLHDRPQLIDEIFTAKGNRTKMEETPVQVLPETESNSNFIKSAPKQEVEDNDEVEVKEEKKPILDKKDFDMSDIQITGKVSKEDIIEAAENAAFKDNERT